ncbi:hypothetical protein G9A89_011429 [Geosiphon pyriformis]|nr:hypothetical protein G9A89_011429 [Geosiphon pyriformis]
MTQQNWRSAMVVHQLISSSSNSPSGLHSQNLGTDATQNLNSQNYLSFLVIPEDATPSNPETNPIQKLTSNILPAMVTKNETLAAIFSFEFEETIPVPLFSRAALEEKLITAIYTNAKVNGHSIKLILDNGSVGSIITQQLMDQLGRRVDRAVSAHIITTDGATKTPIGEINDFSFEINGIIIPIKVLVMEATQYQALHTRTLATCGHFKPSNAQLLIEFEEETKKPTWELPSVPSWNGNIKGKQKETELIWTSDQAWKTKNDYNKPADWEWEEKDNRKGKGKETTLEETTSTSEITSGWTSLYSVHEPLPQSPYIPLKCKDYKNHWMQTHYYCKPCYRKCYSYPKKQGKWNNEPCLACSEQLLDEGIWNDIPGRGGTCNTLCQYTILISDWVSRVIPITAAWHQTLDHLNIEGATLSEILEIKNNPPEPVDIIHIPNPDAFMDKETDPEDFHKYYQNLAPTREEQKQYLEQLNTRLCDHCLISCNFQYCNECDLIYNPLPCIIYTIPEEIKPISSYTSKSESLFNPNSNSDNDDDKNTSFSSVQIGNNNDDDSNLDSNFDPKYEQYIALPDLFKEQKLK